MNYKAEKPTKIIGERMMIKCTFSIRLKDDTFDSKDLIIYFEYVNFKYNAKAQSYIPIVNILEWKFIKKELIPVDNFEQKEYFELHKYELQPKDNKPQSLLQIVDLEVRKMYQDYNVQCSYPMEIAQIPKTFQKYVKVLDDKSESIYKDLLYGTITNYTSGHTRICRHIPSETYEEATTRCAPGKTQLTLGIKQFLFDAPVCKDVHNKLWKSHYFGC